MRILAMDTSNQTMTVAVVENGITVAEQTTNVKRNHSIQLMPAVQRVIQDAGMKIEEIDRVVVAKGPGSYTGVRIAVTVAKTLAWTREIELVGVSSLKVLAGNAPQGIEALVVPIMDARRGNIYTGLYRFVNGKLEQLEKDQHVSAETWVNRLLERKEPVIIVGTDSEKHREVFQRYLKDRLVVLPEFQQLPKASVLAWIGAEEEPVDVHTFVPEYTKLTEAEEKWNEANPDNKGGSLVEKY